MNENVLIDTLSYVFGIPKENFVFEDLSKKKEEPKNTPKNENKPISSEKLTTLIYKIYDLCKCLSFAVHLLDDAFLDKIDAVIVSALSAYVSTTEASSIYSSIIEIVESIKDRNGQEEALQNLMKRYSDKNYNG